MCLPVRLSFALLLAAPLLAEASCFSVYNGQNVLVYQSTITPVDLSLPIADATRDRFPGNYLVMIPDESRCNEFRTGATVRPRFDGLGITGGSTIPNNQKLEASPLLRNSPAPISSSVGASPTRASETDPLLNGSARSGPSSNLKR